MITIDGSMGEGGGQVLRTSLALAILTQTPIHLHSIRAGRSKPGLQPQHLQAVQAAASICGGQVQGAALHSRELFFEPGEIHAGRYRFDIGTAGSAPLVFQTVFLPLSYAKEATTVTIIGGTHVPHSPCYHYLERQWLPMMHSLGFRARISLEQAGFIPQGGGIINAHIRPVRTVAPLTRLVPGSLLRVRGVTAAANLEAAIARRQKLQALRRLEPLCRDSKIETIDLPSQGKGTLLLVQGEFEQASCCYFGLGAIGKRAERVADEAVDAFEAFITSGGALDEYLADQLILPLAFATSPSRYRTARVTRHLLTQAALVPMFLPIRVEIDADEGQPGTVTILPD
jgi:RNA 3'-terminal phosphate cyclase (ATP)